MCGRPENTTGGLNIPIAKPLDQFHAQVAGQTLILLHQIFCSHMKDRISRMDEPELGVKTLPNTI
jgi:hypothetical protein